MGGGTLYNQTDVLHGTYNWGWQFTIEDTHWLEFSRRFGTVTILADPQFQLQPMDKWQPAQLAVNLNILQWTWPKIGPLIVQTALSGGWQWNKGDGHSATWGAGLDLSTSYLPWLHLGGQVQLVNTVDDQGKLHSQVQLPLATMSAAFRF